MLFSKYGNGHGKLGHAFHAPYFPYLCYEHNMAQHSHLSAVTADRVKNAAPHTAVVQQTPFGGAQTQIGDHYGSLWSSLLVSCTGQLLNSNLS